VISPTQNGSNVKGRRIFSGLFEFVLKQYAVVRQYVVIINPLQNALIIIREFSGISFAKEVSES
jgi:hypothetical protein